MLERRPVFPGVIEMNYQAGWRIGCNVYLVYDDRDWALIDIGYEESVDEVIELIRQMDFPLSQCQALVATHADVDHIQGLAKAKSILKAPVLAHPKAVPSLESGDRIKTFAEIDAQNVHLDMPKVKVDRPIVDGDRIDVGGRGIDRVGLAPPGNRPEAREERGQIGAGGDAPGEARDGMERAGGFGRRATDVRADKRVGDQALAGVRAAADGGDQQRLPRHLRPQLAVEGAVPCGSRRIGDAERGGHWRQSIDRSAEFSHASSPGGKRRRGGLATGHHALPRLGTPLLLIHHAGRRAAAFVATAVSPP
jgi:hypothetical protein